MRDAFSASLVELAQADPNVLLLTGDHGYALFDEFRRLCPDQYINAGIAEQNMVGMASGLARTGFRPFVYGLAAFIPIRTVEQIKLDIAHDSLPVVLLGDGAGFVYSHLGTSHQSTEDISCIRAIPNVEILSPGDRFEMSEAMQYAYKANRPVYLRMGKSDRGDVHSTPVPASEDRHLHKLRDGNQNRPSIISTGSMVKPSLEIAEKLDLGAWSAPTLKPLNIEDICSIARNSSFIITIEEHSVYGGLGAVVAEITSEHSPIRLLRLGVQDRFSHFCGSYEYLLSEHRLDNASLMDQIVRFSELQIINSGR
jgi:transketolase